MPKTYLGSCHCEEVRFNVKAEIDCLRACNCSICSKRGALIFRVGKDDMELLSPVEHLSIYKWGTHTGTDYFCSKCGVLPFRQPSHPSKEEIDAGMKRFDGWAINARCLDELDISSIPIETINGVEIIIR